MPSSTPVSVHVVLPVYKPWLTPYEHISLVQCLKVLGHYSIWLVAPHTLDVSAYYQVGPQLKIKTFDDRYFADIQGYNRLMLSEEFYQSFADEEYVLIHQLDAFVFRDELAYWCQQRYDYIGAPLLRDRDFRGWIDKLDFTIRQRIATWLNLKKADGITPREISTLNLVGNGGLSLRRVSAMLSSRKRFHRKIDAYERSPLVQHNEDVFWSREVNRYWPWLRIPSYRKALHFSVEFYPEWAVEHYNKGNLPFGCHAWDIHGTAYWRPIFARLGYSI